MAGSATAGDATFCCVPPSRSMASCTINGTRISALTLASRKVVAISATAAWARVPDVRILSCAVRPAGPSARATRRVPNVDRAHAARRSWRLHRTRKNVGSLTLGGPPGTPASMLASRSRPPPPKAPRKHPGRAGLHRTVAGPRQREITCLVLRVLRFAQRRVSRCCSLWRASTVRRNSRRRLRPPGCGSSSRRKARCSARADRRRRSRSARSTRTTRASTRAISTSSGRPATRRR